MTGQRCSHAHNSPEKTSSNGLKNCYVNSLASLFTHRPSFSEVHVPCFPGFPHQIGLFPSGIAHPSLTAFSSLPHSSPFLLTFQINYQQILVSFEGFHTKMQWNHKWWNQVLEDQTGMRIKAETDELVHEKKKDILQGWDRPCTDCQGSSLRHTVFSSFLGIPSLSNKISEVSLYCLLGKPWMGWLLGCPFLPKADNPSSYLIEWEGGSHQC